MGSLLPCAPPAITLKVVRHYPVAVVNPPAAAEATKAEDPRTDGNQTEIYQYNKEYEAALNRKKEGLDAQQGILNEQERELQVRERDLRHSLEAELDGRQKELDQRERELVVREEDIRRQERKTLA